MPPRQRPILHNCNIKLKFTIKSLLGWDKKWVLFTPDTSVATATACLRGRVGVMKSLFDWKTLHSIPPDELENVYFRQVLQLYTWLCSNIQLYVILWFSDCSDSVTREYDHIFFHSDIRAKIPNGYLVVEHLIDHVQRSSPCVRLGVLP